MADKKAKDKELSTNSEVKRADEFQDRITTKEKVMESVRELLESTTEDAFSKLGYQRVEGKAGVYGDESEYGSGAKENKYQIRLAGKTKSNVEKQIIFGAKRLESQINIDYRDDVVVIEYKTTEAAAFRGANRDSKYTGTGKAMMVNEKATIPVKSMKEFDKKLKEMFEDAAKREIEYLTSTKLGVEDRLEAGTTSTVNENENITEMENLSLKSLLFGDEEPATLNEGKKSSENIQKVKSANTIPLKDVKPKSDKSDKGKFMFLDSKKEDEIKKEDKEIAEDTGAGAGVTASGPSGSGAGAYATPFAFKNTAYFKNKSSKRPKVDKDYNVVKETKGNKDGFWSVVKVDPDYHPLGMPFVKPGSKEEWNNTIKGDKTKYKRMGLKEGVEKIVPPLNIDLTKKKIFSEEENKAKGINKRYLVTERTSDEYLKERWGKLSQFKTYETIKEAEEMNRIFEEVDSATEETIQKPLEQIAESFIQNEEQIIDETILKEDASHSISSDEETVEVEKPNSDFGISHKFYKKDFMNEEKKYILDINSMVFVPNPNAKYSK
jgi:hypothetical protein